MSDYQRKFTIQVPSNATPAQIDRLAGDAAEREVLKDIDKMLDGLF